MEIWVILLTFLHEPEMSGVTVQRICYNSKKELFCEKLLSENDFKVVLATCCCNDDGANISEAVQKIATDQKDYHKCSLCVIVWWIAKIYQSMSVKKG